MHGTILHAAGDVRFEERPDPELRTPTDAIVRVTATCVCGSDLWPYRGISPVTKPRPIGHEYVGVVEAIGQQVTGLEVGQFVVGPFFACDNTCPHCRAGFQSVCEQLDWYDGCQSELLRVPLADGTLVAAPEQPDDDLIPSLLTLSDVMGTGWHAATMAGVQPGMTVAVVGDGAVGLCGVLACAQLGAARVIAMSRHESRQRVATAFGATDIVEERGVEGVTRINELTDGVGADAVLECVGTGDAMLQALSCARPGAMVGYVGVPHGVELPVRQMFERNVGVRGGMAPVRNYLPQLMQRVLAREIEPGLVFDLELPLAEVAQAYAAMDDRRAIKALLRP
ncbi:zinc-dependent alcohol dehydrogenase family protein [Micropruina sonneratiae]|uniref:zinc-dependent alcohol dehydrogenase family protein n=1 Tax=Micropruina sonneratiae TaxID=2986940 RepID=UPI002227641C|nr:zinc-dependent alcohol dehydrogenase family protein [Micropruina sp. KQZ13P-5]MCW3156604.1 zinc-dependent alcohol dehydrogenase family protein [Micropruina sp. KQZ13P-5]